MTSAEAVEIIKQIYRLKVGQAEKHVLIYALIVFKGRVFDLSLAAWSEGVGLGRNTVWRALKSLVELKYLSLKGYAHYQTVEGEEGLEREQTGNSYQLNLAWIERKAK